MIDFEISKIPTNTNINVIYNSSSNNNDIKDKIATWLTTKYNMIYNDIKPEQIFMTNGSISALYILITKYNIPGNKIIIDNPTNHKIIEILEEYDLDIEGADDIKEVETIIKNCNQGDTKQDVIFYYMQKFIDDTDERVMISNLCKRYKNLYIIADETNHMLYENTYTLANYHSKIVSLGCFSKIVCESINVGWIYINTELSSYNTETSLFEGEYGLLNSAIANSMMFNNIIGYQYIHSIINNIDDMILLQIKNLKDKYNNIIEFLSLFDDIDIISSEGGYNMWIQFKTIKNTTDFLKICMKNNVKFIPGNKCSIYNNSFMNSIMISYLYYDIPTIISGLEKIIDSIVKYNKINVKINGNVDINFHKDINYIGQFNKTNYIFDGMIPFNSVIIDTTDTTDMIEYMLKNKIYLPLLVTTNSVSTILLKKYGMYAPVAHINNIEDDIFWILTKDNGYYESKTASFIGILSDNISIYDINKKIHPIVLDNMIQKILYDNSTQRKVIIKQAKKKEFEVIIYDNMKQVEYCLESLRCLINYINNEYNINSGKIIIGDNVYIFNDMHIMLPLVNHEIRQTDNINYITTQMTNLTLYGVSHYSSSENKYYIIDLDDDIMTLDILETLSSLINDSDKYTIIYINGMDECNMRVFDINNIETNYDPYILSCILEYYKYNKTELAELYINTICNKKIKLIIENKINMI